MNQVKERRREITGGKTITEPAKDIPVFGECDVLIVGGGPAGCAAAACSSQTGANTILMERYGCLGGMSTAGLVVWIDRMTDWNGQQVISGFANDLLDRLPEDAILSAPKNLWSSKDDEVVKYWHDRSSVFHGMVTWSPTVDPEMLKMAYFEIMLERNVRLILHSWAVAVVQEGNKICGVIFESKSGRQAILAKMVIDATGDGDVLALAGAPFECDFIQANSDEAANIELTLPLNLDNTMNVAFLVAGVNMPRYRSFCRDHPDEYNTRVSELGLTARGHFMPRDDICLFMGPKLSGYSPVSVEDLTTVEIESRKRIKRCLDVFRKNIPGFESAWIMTTASQIGTRHSRRLVGLKRMNWEEWVAGRIHKDEIGICPSPSPRYPNVSIPLGCLLPIDLENLLVAGRNLSCDPVTHSFMREIPVCWVMGQAAGTLAALSIDKKIKPKDFDIKILQENLRKQMAILG